MEIRYYVGFDLSRARALIPARRRYVKLSKSGHMYALSVRERMERRKMQHENVPATMLITRHALSPF